jgi:hypothetical protein
MKILDIPRSGSYAGVTSSHNRAGQYVRNRRSPVQPVGTGRRAFIRQAFGAASSAWASLSTAVQAAWTSYAVGHPITDSLGQAVTLTGQQMFVSIYTQTLNCGVVGVPSVPSTASVFSPGTPTFTFVHSGAVTLTPTGLGAAGDFLLYAFSPPVSAGVNFPPPFWQAGHVAGNSVAAIVATTAYNAQFGTAVAGQKVFAKVTPVNAGGVTGVPNIVTAVVS